MIRKIFKYLETIWCSKDNKPSIRRLMSLYFVGLFTYETIKPNTEVEVLWVIAAIIAGLLSLTTFQNISFGRDRQNPYIDKVED